MLVYDNKPQGPAKTSRSRQQKQNLPKGELSQCSPAPIQAWVCPVPLQLRVQLSSWQCQNNGERLRTNEDFRTGADVSMYGYADVSDVLGDVDV